MNKSVCERPDQLQRFESALAEITGERVGVQFELDQASEPVAEARPREVPRRQRTQARRDHPMVQRACELFGAQPTRVEEPKD